MEFHKKHLKDWIILKMPKEINYECNFSLKSELEKLWEKGEQKICLDLSKTNFIGSLSIGLFSFAQKYLDNIGGEFCLISPNRNIEDTLEIMGITKIIRIIQNESGLN